MRLARKETNMTYRILQIFNGQLILARKETNMIHRILNMFNGQLKQQNEIDCRGDTDRYIPFTLLT